MTRILANHLLAINAHILAVTVRAPGGDQAPGDQGAGVLRPAGLDGQIGQIYLIAFNHLGLAGGLLDHLGRHVHHLTEDRQLLPGIAHPLGRVRLLEESQQLADLAQGVDGLGPHAQGHPLGGTEEITQDRHLMACGVFKQQGRTLGTQGAIADFGHFQVGADRMADPPEQFPLFQLADEVSKILVLHGARPLLARDGECEAEIITGQDRERAQAEGGRSD